MSKSIISATDISKKYSLGERQPYYSFRDTLSNVFSKPIKRLVGKDSKLKKDEFWALKNVSFDIQEGEVVGIIGRNGAGKSTLLKILSQITPPTSGEIKLNGRVASLLEVGTGFHPELTGKENIYLNGAILGMKRWEINNKFDDIVEFAEISKFLDTPVKHYSSGMYMRLAFAVAAHLEPEILLIDEVLAVGDAAFQKKCLGKMDEISKQSGRTILFVSHNMGAIQELCSKTILLEYGKISENGETNKVINKYLASSNRLSDAPLFTRKDRVGNQSVIIRGISIYQGKDKGKQFKSGDELTIEVEIENLTKEKHDQVEVALEIFKRDGQPLIYLGTRVKKNKFSVGAMEKKRITCEIDKLPLEPGDYSMMAEVIVEGSLSDLITDAKIFDVVYGDFYGTGMIWPVGGILVDYEWNDK